MGKPSDLPLILRLLFAGAAGPGLLIMKKASFGALLFCRRGGPTPITAGILMPAFWIVTADALWRDLPR
jgi:hypothetical protein